MGLDLSLTALPPAAGFALAKARARPAYAAEFDKILDPDHLRQHLRMLAATPADPAAAVLREMLADTEQILTQLPAGQPLLTFYSGTRGYATLDYLLEAWLAARGQPLPAGRYVFYGGTALDSNGEHAYFQYLTPAQVAAVAAVLAAADFAALLEFYDYERLWELGVYKLTRPQSLPYLAEEYAELQAFYRAAATQGAAVLARRE